jgi:hypothetical protein
MLHLRENCLRKMASQKRIYFTVKTQPVFILRGDQNPVMKLNTSSILRVQAVYWRYTFAFLNFSYANCSGRNAGILNLHHEKMAGPFTRHVGTSLVDCFLPASVGTDFSNLVLLAQEDLDLPSFPYNLLRGRCLPLHLTSPFSWTSGSKLIFGLIFGGQVTVGQNIKILACDVALEAAST